MDIQALQSRSWNGTPITRRSTDGFVNATAMCKANSKRWSDFRESVAATTYMEALARKTGARGLRSILEQALIDTMFELPNASNVEKVVVDASTIEENHVPLLVYRESAKQA